MFMAGAFASYKSKVSINLSDLPRSFYYTSLGVAPAHTHTELRYMIDK